VTKNEPHLATPPRKHPEYLLGIMIVRIEEPAVRPQVGARPLRFTSEAATLLPDPVAEPLDYLRTHAGLKTVEPLFSTRQRQVRQANVSASAKRTLAVLSSVVDSASEELAGINVLTMDPKKLTPSVVRHVDRSKAVVFAQRVPTRWLAAASADPSHNLQWGLRAISWFQASRPDTSKFTGRLRLRHLARTRGAACSGGAVV
jgi:hypothetical protein